MDDSRYPALLAFLSRAKNNTTSCLSQGAIATGIHAGLNLAVTWEGEHGEAQHPGKGKFAHQAAHLQAGLGALSVQGMNFEVVGLVQATKCQGLYNSGSVQARQSFATKSNLGCSTRLLEPVLSHAQKEASRHVWALRRCCADDDAAAFAHSREKR